MSDRLQRYLQRLEIEFPEYVVVARPYRSPDDDTIDHFLHLLRVPEEDLGPATRKAFEIAFEMYGDEPLRFHLTAIDPETSQRYFANELEEARWTATPSPFPSLVSSRATASVLLASSGPSGVAPAVDWFPDASSAPGPDAVRRSNPVQAPSIVFRSTAAWSARVYAARDRAPGSYPLAS